MNLGSVLVISSSYRKLQSTRGIISFSINVKRERGLKPSPSPRLEWPLLRMTSALRCLVLPCGDRTGRFYSSS